mmetsp:Transcript_159116/g.510314  ORF Transcript_159116/g.510314 Transcript_159116/m.510314 type:complete len:227 (-) Transcript_159116:380-1060(-)
MQRRDGARDDGRELGDTGQNRRACNDFLRHLGDRPCLALLILERRRGARLGDARCPTLHRGLLRRCHAAAEQVGAAAAAADGAEQTVQIALCQVRLADVLEPRPPQPRVHPALGGQCPEAECRMAHPLAGGAAPRRGRSWHRRHGGEGGGGLGLEDTTADQTSPQDAALLRAAYQASPGPGAGALSGQRRRRLSGGGNRRQSRGKAALERGWGGHAAGRGAPVATV